MRYQRTTFSALAETVGQFIVDAVVIQYSTIFFIIGSTFAYLCAVDHQANAALLLQCTLIQQLATNFSLARERAVEIANKDADELWHHIGRRYIFVVLLAGGGMAAAGASIKLVMPVALLCGLATATVTSHSASQLRPDMAALRPATFASAIVLGASFPILSLAPLFAASVFALTSCVLAATLYQFIGPVRGISMTIKPTSGSWQRLSLWLVGLATAEYDRYLFAATGSSAVGLQYGLLSTALILPLTVTIVVGPRLTSHLLSPRARALIIGAVSAYICMLLFFATTLLDRDQLIVFAGSALKTVFLVACADLYFYVMARNSTQTVAAGMVSTAVSTLGTVALLMNHEVLAASLRVLAGPVLLLILVVFMRRGLR